MGNKITVILRQNKYHIKAQCNISASVSAFSTCKYISGTQQSTSISADWTHHMSWQDVLDCTCSYFITYHNHWSLVSYIHGNIAPAKECFSKLV